MKQYQKNATAANLLEKINPTWYIDLACREDLKIYRRNKNVNQLKLRVVERLESIQFLEA